MPRTKTQAALGHYLDRLLLRSRLTEEEQQAILALPSQAMVVDVRHDFVRPGDKLTHACLIVDGLAARFAQIRNGQRSVVALHIPGDMADLHSVVAPKVTWALHAVTPSTILQVPHAALHDLTQRYPAIGTAFWRDCVVDANILAQWAVNIARKDAVARVAHILCEMEVRYRAVGLCRGNAFPFPITQINLADAVGLTPVHINRVLRRLKEDGVAVKTAWDLRILDGERLRALAEFDSDYLELVRADDPR